MQLGQQGLQFGRDSNGVCAYAPYDANYIYSLLLIADTAVTIPVPQSSKFWTVAFSYQPGSIVFVDDTGTAAVAPIDDTVAVTTSELLKGPRTISSLYEGSPREISILSVGNDAYISVAFYANTVF